ncbi:Retrovirus-related Pol polyprotein from transposon gypsy, partial [Mucuna pruriens]
MDGFSRYNQIRMAPKDKEKTTFITTWGTFCYKVMPFGLKNVEATYQRVMVTLFHNMMHKEEDVYVDDMIAKTTHRRPMKTFRKAVKISAQAKPHQLLGFIVNKRGIELDPDKVKAIRDIPAPKTEIESQLHSPIHLLVDGYLQPNIQTPMEEPKGGIESRMPRSLRKSQAVPRVTSCSRYNST